MKKLLFILLIFSNYSCSKQKKVSKELSGIWELSSLRRTDAEGLISYPSYNGQAQFDPYENSIDSSTYKILLVSSNSVGTDNSMQKGTYRLVENANFMYLTNLDSMNNIISYVKYRILTLTNTDLQIEYSKDNITDVLLFERK
jgi:hypothetical protein